MSLVDIHGATNSEELRYENVQSTNGHLYNFTIPAHSALIDQHNYIRFFTAVFDDGNAASYILQPKKTSRNKQLAKIDWIAGFLSQYGISFLKGRFVQRQKNGQSLAIDLAVYLATQWTAHTIKSFEHKLLFDNNVDLGYYNAVTENFAWDIILRIKPNL